MGLNLLIDNADPNEWEAWSSVGIFQGITTNPTLLKQANQTCNLLNICNLIKRAEHLGYREIHIQSWGDSPGELIDNGIKIGELKTNNIRIYVKLPITEIGTKAANIIISRQIAVTFTACYEVEQVLIAAALGANYIAPYLGRINDLESNGKEKVKRMQTILSGLNSSCKLLVASIREINDINFLASHGTNTFTISPKLAKSLFNSEPTILASKVFEADVINDFKK